MKTRRFITIAALSPGLALALSGDAAAFLLWLGGSAAAGWLVTLSLAKNGEPASE